ncbi:BT4734/BF3469 family protein [Gaetbulibacter aestuarii]|uniref:BT4734/BF3469 family protein n=1 Tax=Gaetbulibacter aestuarii TaxID=1502358 RepID=A0ABW7N2S4_9FLAO
MINYFKCATNSSKVLGSISIQEYLNKIQNGDDNLNYIKKARDLYFDKASYSKIKINKLPCYTLNFTFNKYRWDENIIDSTGFIYIDIDGQTEINLSHTLLYASWISLSGKGRGALVKVKNLNPNNFFYTYDKLSEELGVTSDKKAKKRNQLNILSYDPDIYINDNSEYWTCKSNNLNYPHYSDKIKKTIIPTVLGENSNKDIRYDNLDMLLPKIDFDGEVLYDFKEKINFSKVKIPFKVIENGSRNNILSSIAYQIRALNPFMECDYLSRIMHKINKDKCIEPLQSSEINGMIRSIMNVELEDLKPIINASRRFIYNEDYDIPLKEKRSLTMTAINADRVKNSKQKIEKAIEEWNFETDGKITQKSLATATEMNKKTIEKYYPLYKSEIQLLNKKYHKNQKHDITR